MKSSLVLALLVSLVSAAPLESYGGAATGTAASNPPAETSSTGNPNFQPPSSAKYALEDCTDDAEHKKPWQQIAFYDTSSKNHPVLKEVGRPEKQVKWEGNAHSTLTATQQIIPYIEKDAASKKYGEKVGDVAVSDSQGGAQFRFSCFKGSGKSRDVGKGKCYERYYCSY